MFSGSDVGDDGDVKVEVEEVHREGRTTC